MLASLSRELWLSQENEYGRMSGQTSVDEVEVLGNPGPPTIRSQTGVSEYLNPGHANGNGHGLHGVQSRRSARMFLCR